MTTRYRTRALILGKRDFREADRFFTFFAKKYGKVEAMAKAERKIRSKLRGGLELFYLSEIEFIQGRNWKTLVDASLVDNFNEIRKDLYTLKVSYKISEVFKSLVRGQEQDLELWKLLKDSFERLDKGENGFLVYQYFFWNFLGILGYWPQLYQCSECNKELEQKHLYFSPTRGGLVCEDCMKQTDRTKRIHSDVVKILRVILEKDFDSFRQVNLKGSHSKDLVRISDFSFYTLKNL